MAPDPYPYTSLVLRQLPDISLPGGIDIDLPGNDNDNTPNTSTGTRTTTTTGRPTNTSNTSTLTTSTSTTTTSTTPTTRNTSTTPSTTSSSTSTSNTPPPTSTTSEQILVQTSTSNTDTLNTQTTSTTVVTKETTVSGAPQETASTNQTGAAKKGFLDNKVLSGVVFGICGLVALILIAIAIFFILRRTRRKKELDEVISWDPEDVGKFHNRDREETSSIDKVMLGRSGSSNHGHGSAGSYGDEKAGAGVGPYTGAAPFASYNAGAAAATNPAAAQRPINLSFPATAHVPPPQYNRPGWQQGYNPPGNANYYGGMS